MRYSLWQNIKYLSNYSRAIACLHADLELVPKAEVPKEFSFKRINQNDVDDLTLWAKIVTDAYGDKKYCIDDAKKHFQDHLFLNITDAFFLLHGSDSVATISVGTYKNNARVGGDALIAVIKAYQNKGIGKLLIRYGFNELLTKGIKYGESVITATRTASIKLHYKCGFYPPHRKNKLFSKIRNASFLFTSLLKGNLEFCTNNI